MSQENTKALLAEVSTIAAAVKQSLNAPAPAAAPSSLAEKVKAVLAINDETLALAVGDRTLKRCRTFFEVCEPDHPDLGSLFADSTLDFLLELVRASQSINDCPRIKALLPTLMRWSAKQELRNLGDPLKNGSLVRFLKTDVLRDAARRQKSPQPVDLGLLYRNGVANWKAQIDSFKMFVRGSTLYQEELNRAKHRIGKYQRFGLTSMANEIERSIHDYNILLTESYYGFHRIKMTKAAAILAKAHSFEAYHNDYDRFRLIISNAAFGGDPYSLGHCEYAPVAYPLYALEKVMTAGVRELVHTLDHFPEANGKAIFDHFVVLVPAVYGGNVPINDISLIQKGMIFPVLLGERQGKCYFISYFA